MQQPHKRRRKKKQANRAIVTQAIGLLIDIQVKVTHHHDKEEIAEAIRVLQKLLSGGLKMEG